MIKTHNRLLAAALTAVLLVSAAPARAAQDTEKRAARQADLDFLVSTLESAHPNCYANVSREAFAAKKAEIETNITDLDDFGFAVELQTLTAMLGDSHTTLNISADADVHILPFHIGWYDGRWTLTAAPAANQDDLGCEITGIGGLAIDEVQKKLEPLISYDNAVELRSRFAGNVYVWELLQHFGVVSDDASQIELEITAADGQKHALMLAPLPLDEAKQAGAVSLSKLSPDPVTAYDRSSVYKLLELDENTLYIQYNACREDPALSMESFAVQVRDKLENEKIGRIIIDLRNNGGGSDGVIWPVLYQLIAAMQRGVAVDALIGERTFSSAIINAVQLKQLGARLVGSETNGSVDHFGSVASFTLPNSGLRLGCSSKMIALGDFYVAAKPFGVAPLTPDLQAPQTLADLKAGVDTAVATILKEPVNVPAAQAQAAPSAARALINGKVHVLAGYLIDGAYYVRLRDLAAALSGTEKQVSVLWDEEQQAVVMASGQPYAQPDQEAAAASTAVQTATAAGAMFVLDEMPLALSGEPGAIHVYKILDNHYIKLRDLAAKFSLQIDWDQENGTIKITV